jgi:hypothetical protein
MENDYLFLIMLVTGYFGEVVDPGNAALWDSLQELLILNCL